MRRLVHVLTVPDSLVFLRGQAAFMRERGWEPIVVTSPGEDLFRFGQAEGIEVRPLPMPRAITPGGDLAAVARLTQWLREWKPALVHAHTPKGGLLGTLAAAAARVRARIYHMRGLPLMTATGVRRTLLTSTERVSCGAATHVLCVSHSLKRVALELKLVRPEKIEVLLQGSGNGVDSGGRFDRLRLPAGTREKLRAELRVEDDALVFGFVGRLVVDKGIRELAAAWPAVRAQFPRARLVLVGEWEEKDQVPASVRQALAEDPTVRITGFRRDTPELYTAMDVVVLPTYREGFPNVPLEAASMRLPVIATKIPGCEDAVADGQTGVLVRAQDAAELQTAMTRLAVDAALRRAMGDAGRLRVEQSFRRERIWQALAETYERQVA
jgi:glycosyltransferase involved in cell wall biosynthesis